VILAFDLAWISAVRGRGTPGGFWILMTSGGVVWVWPVTLALAAIAVWRRRRLRLELETLNRLRLEDPRAGT